MTAAGTVERGPAGGIDGQRQQSSLDMNTESAAVSDRDGFLAVCYFGSGDRGDWLNRCILRAYLDMNRTLHGMKEFATVEPRWKPRMTAHLRQQLEEIPKNSKWAEEEFDRWHEETILSLQVLSSSMGFAIRAHADPPPSTGFTVGQAQKWINMSVKYAIVLGEDRVPGFLHICPVAHAPLDSIVLASLVNDGMETPGVPWSRLNRYDTYMRCQTWMRERYPGETALQVENRIWLQRSPKERGDR
jgi:hypothetical protein